MASQFDHLLEEYKDIDKYIEENGTDRVAARRLLIFTEAFIGHIALNKEEKHTEEDLKALQELMKLNRIAQGKLMHMGK